MEGDAAPRSPTPNENLDPMTHITASDKKKVT